MDPSGELLQVVTQPVCAWLLERPIRHYSMHYCQFDRWRKRGWIVWRAEEASAKPLEEAQLDEEDEGEPPTFDWEPPPSNLKRRGVITGQVGRVTSSYRRAGKILTMLVGIYGSKNLFVNEYRIMMADKLWYLLIWSMTLTRRFIIWSCWNYDLGKPRWDSVRWWSRTLVIPNASIQIFIIHFHQTPEIMARQLLMLQLSLTYFCLRFKRKRRSTTPISNQTLDEFSIEYAKLKNPHQLVWMKQLGSVELEVEAYEEDEDGNLILTPRKSPAR